MLPWLGTLADFVADFDRTRRQRKDVMLFNTDGGPHVGVNQFEVRMRWIQFTRRLVLSALLIIHRASGDPAWAERTDAAIHQCLTQGAPFPASQLEYLFEESREASMRQLVFVSNLHVSLQFSFSSLSFFLLFSSLPF